MHRHGYRGRKFARERDQRRALLKGLLRSLILHRSIKTTVDKAKELRPLAEKVITRARRGGLYNRRLVIARVGDVGAGNLLVDVIAPQIKRDSGYLRIAKLDNRRGDNTLMAEISFVDEIKVEVEVESKEAAAKAEKAATTEKKPATPKPAAKKTVAKKEDK
ncbi:MAG: 50S ribosomal protein L17 [Candidatus Nomurabacteria bacterium]|jgi:large subunit ribosomal protein L17|nr:50S ribosomal protein L17 [Candidatus Nomurabacteria bacterium]